MEINYIFDSFKGLNNEKNKDSTIIIDNDDCLLFVLFDGVGSAKNALRGVELCSDFIKNNYKNFLKDTLLSFNDLMFEANEYIKEKNIEEPYTTYVALFIHKKSDAILISSMGDSRFYGISKQYITQYSKDDKGELTNTITKCIGMNELAKNDFKTIVIDKPEKRLLLCSDGFYHFIEKDKLDFFEILNYTNLKNIQKRIEKVWGVRFLFSRTLTNITFMKKAIVVFGLLALGLFPIVSMSAPSLSAKLKGKILLAVEDRGKTYFVHDDGNKYLITKDTAQKVFEKLAIGIKNQDLAQIPEKKLNLDVATTTQPNTCDPKIVEKIVYQEKIVEKPVYINTCSSGTSVSQNQNTATISYSEYTPTYVVKDRYDGETTPRSGVRIVVFDKFTARKISIKKMVFRSSEPAGNLRLTFDTNDGTSKSYISRPHGEFYLSGTDKFLYTNEIAIGNYPFSITVITSDTGKVIEPDISEWELWDNTDNKPIKMQ